MRLPRVCHTRSLSADVLIDAGPAGTPFLYLILPHTSHAKFVYY
jgi:hypothetical protein